MKILLIACCVLISLTIDLLWSTQHAQSTEKANSTRESEYVFKSKFDQFTVNINSEGVTYNGHPTNAEPFKFVKSLFAAKFTDLCDLGTSKHLKPDLTITKKIISAAVVNSSSLVNSGVVEAHRSTAVKRQIYFSKKIVSDGENCGKVDGQGLFLLPLHHDWFDGKKSLSINLGEQFSIWKDDLLVFEFQKTNGRWHNLDTNFFTNWDFFEKFENMLREFQIDFRAHPLAGKDHTAFEIRVNNQLPKLSPQTNNKSSRNVPPGTGFKKYTFTRVGESTWAVQLPDSPWLIASGDFGLFSDMDQKIWISPYSKSLSLVTNTTADVSSRIKAVRSLAEHWGSDVKSVFFDALNIGGDASDVKKEIANILRLHPTDESFVALFTCLQSAGDMELKNYISKILKIRNPKGSTIELDDDTATVILKTQEWEAWMKKLGLLK